MGDAWPEQCDQDNGPNDAPCDPGCDRVLGLPFQDSFVKGHDLLSCVSRHGRTATPRSDAPLPRSIQARIMGDAICACIDHGHQLDPRASELTIVSAGAK
jgi:hypothetical protein